MTKNLNVILVAIISITLPSIHAAGGKNNMPHPDFTKGDPIPAGATHDWALGSTGARGWMYSERMETSPARQVAITKIANGSPADGVLKVGDILLGVGGKAFSYDPRTEMGKAITAAETEKQAGKLALTVWREGKAAELSIKLPVLGRYSATAPYNCPKSTKILKTGCAALAKRIAADGYKPRAITRSLNALALLASGDESYLPIVKKEAQWAADYTTNGYKTWHYGYVIMLLSEYVMATGDQSVMPGLQRLAMEAANGQSVVGSWGHRFAGEDGRLGGYGMMNAPGIPLTLSLVMARAAGVKDPQLDKAIERSAKLLRFYQGKGAIPYGDHHPWIQTHEDNGKAGMAAVLFNALDEQGPAEFFSRMATASHGNERDGGHTGNFFNVLWSMPAISLSGPHATGAWMDEFGAWYFDLARSWDGSFSHQGPPAMRTDSYKGWDCSGAYLLAYAMPLKKIWLTGKRPSKVREYNASGAKAVVASGRGWSNNDRNSAYDAMDQQELIKRLSSWSPVIRERAAMAMGRKKDKPVTEVIALLDSPRLESRYGACQALTHFKGAAAPAVEALQENLEHRDLWVRVKAAEALAEIGKPAVSAIPQLLEMLANPAAATDPRNMEQRYLSFAVFGKMLKRSIDGVDRDLLRKAVVAGLKNEDGRARGSVGQLYQKLALEEIEPLLPAIHEAIATPAPSGIMFANGIRLSGVELLAKHQIEEGMPLCLKIIQIDKWGKQDRIKRCIGALEQYGTAAKPLLPELCELEKDLKAHREAKNLQPHIERVTALVRTLETSKEPAPKLRSIK